MADPTTPPIDLDEIFAPYSAVQPKTKLTGKDNSSILDVTKNLFREGRGNYVLGGVGVTAAGYGVSKAWDKSVASNLELVKQAAKEEADAVASATKAGFSAKPATLNRPLVGIMEGATSGGAGIPTTEAGQLALAKDVTRSKWLRPFGLGKYADAVLEPKVSIQPTYVTPTYAYDANGLRIPVEKPVVAKAPAQLVTAKNVPSIVATGSETGASLTPTVGLNLPNGGLKPNLWQTGGKALVNSYYGGNAVRPILSAGDAGAALFKSGLGLSAVAEGITGAYDMWPTFLGGSGNNVYGRTVEELRRGVNPETDPFAYNVVAPIGGTLANLKRAGYGASNALLVGAPYMYNEMSDISGQMEKATKELDTKFEQDPKQFHPDELERNRLRRIRLGVATETDVRGPANTPEAFDEYNAKLKKLKEKNNAKK